MAVNPTSAGPPLQVEAELFPQVYEDGTAFVTELISHNAGNTVTFWGPEDLRQRARKMIEAANEADRLGKEAADNKNGKLTVVEKKKKVDRLGP